MRSTAWHQLARVRARIDDAARAAGRDPADVRLLAVTKTEDAAAVRSLFEAGQRDFGESRPQELEQKRAALRASVGDAAREARWHLVGHLQTNKARRTLAHLDVLHSLDRDALIEPLIEAGAARAAASIEAPLDVFVQVKLADEANKGGFAAGEVAGVLERLADRPGLRVVGLMTLAPWIEPEAERRRAAARVFLQLAQLGKDLGPGAFQPNTAQFTPQFTAQFTVQLSMGMSGDLEEAIAAGSTWVRVGSALFEGAPGAEH